MNSEKSKEKEKEKEREKRDREDKDIEIIDREAERLKEMEEAEESKRRAAAMAEQLQMAEKERMYAEEHHPPSPPSPSPPPPDDSFSPPPPPEEDSQFNSFYQDTTDSKSGNSCLVFICLFCICGLCKDRYMFFREDASCICRNNGENWMELRTNSWEIQGACIYAK